MLYTIQVLVFSIFLNSGMAVEGDTSELRITALKTLGITEDDVQQRIALIEEWLKEQDFPESMDKNMIEMFLLRTKFRTKVTQTKLAMYYAIRSEIPDFFLDRHPKLINMQRVMKVSYFVFSPILTPELYTVNFFKLIDMDPKNFSPNDFCGQVINNTELKLAQNVYSLGDVYVCDLKGSSISHLYYFGVGTLRKLTKVIQEVFPVSIKAIHFVNSPGYMKTLMSLIKTVLNPKIFSRIHIHKNPEDVANFISKDILPKEFGGEGRSLDDLNKYLRTEYTKHQKRFDELERINGIMSEE